MTHTTAIALTIAGSDSGGGAGIQADLKTFSALGVYGASVITALTAQNTREVRGIYDVDPDFIRLQIDTVCSDLAVDAVKVGMLSRPGVIDSVTRGLTGNSLTNIVVDPVMVAKSGDKLLDDSAVASLQTVLLPLAKVITPNLPEAAVLLDVEPARNEDEMADQAHALLDFGPAAVLIKGGHLNGVESVDLLVTADSIRRYAAPRIATANTHGTGCTLSSSICAGLALGLELDCAVARAKTYLNQAIAGADDLQIGAGHGPVHHFHRFWKNP